MRLRRITIFLLLVGSAVCDKEREEDDASSAFVEAAQALLGHKDAAGGLQGMASAFMQSDVGKQIGDALIGGKSNPDGIGEIFSGFGNLISASSNGQGVDFSMLSTILQTFASTGSSKKAKRDVGEETESFDFDSMLNIASMFLGQSGNSEGMMGLLPMLLENLGSGTADGSVRNKKHDHSSHSWFLPPILENLHVMWDHFSNSELGQTLWKNSGLANIVGMMSDGQGRIRYEKILDSFENRTLRRRWITSLTNFIAEWISHVSDPATQQRYLATGQFVVNSFLKSQGYPKSVIFDSTKPADSLSRLANAVAKRHLNMKIDSSKYVKPAIAYVQELVILASDKGFIMSRINAKELSNRLSETINNDIVAPILKAYRAYKWATKTPKCANHILCVINEKRKDTDKSSFLHKGLTKLASFPAAWAISNRTGVNFWSLYGAILENEGCFDKYPVDCTAFHEEEIRVTTEYVHSEL